MKATLELILSSGFFAYNYLCIAQVDTEVYTILSEKINSMEAIHVNERTSLRKWGNSYAVRIPKTVLSKIDANELPVEFDLKVNNNNEIVLSKKKKAESLTELFEGFDYKKYWSDWEKENPNKSKELDWGEPVGREMF